MRLLLDTHALIWWLNDDRRLLPDARAAISDESNEILVSAVSAWEITTKHRLGKLSVADRFVADIGGALAVEGFQELPLSLADAARAGGLPSDHRDPFDRMLIAQALSNDLTLVSTEQLFERYGVRRLW